MSRDGRNRNLKRRVNGRKRPSNSEKLDNIRNRPIQTQLLQYQRPYRKIARAGKDEMSERVYHRENLQEVSSSDSQDKLKLESDFITSKQKACIVIIDYAGLSTDPVNKHSTN
ncbi:hypothetical protein J3Q64DRAFT_1697948 [Phycomyces blakesleeanus]